MTRGKYATRAEKTQAVKQAASEVEAGRAAIVRLTAENKALRTELDELRAVHRERMDTLSAQLREGTSGEVEALKIRLREETERAEQTKRKALRLIEQALDVTPRNSLAMTGPRAKGVIRPNSGPNKLPSKDTKRTETRVVADYLWQGVARFMTRQELERSGVDVEDDSTW
jgi:regulator of replication initiation timing